MPNCPSSLVIVFYHIFGFASGTRRQSFKSHTPDRGPRVQGTVDADDRRTTERRAHSQCRRGELSQGQGANVAILPRDRIFSRMCILIVKNCNVLSLILSFFTPLPSLQVQALNMSLSDSSSMIAGLQDRIAQMQRALASSEQDRRTLQDRLDNNRYGFGCSRRRLWIIYLIAFYI